MAAGASGTCQPSWGKLTVNFVGTPWGRLPMKPTWRSTGRRWWNRGEIKKPMMGIPSMADTAAPTSCVPSTAKRRRLISSSSRAIAQEGVAARERADDDEYQVDQNRPADQRRR